MNPPIDLYTKDVFNPTEVAFTWRWDGREYTFPPKKIIQLPLGIAEHMLKHLGKKGLRQAVDSDVVRRPTHPVMRAESESITSQAAPVAESPVVPSTQEQSDMPPHKVKYGPNGGKKYIYEIQCMDPDGCDYTNPTVDGLQMHQRMKHRRVTEYKRS